MNCPLCKCTSCVEVAENKWRKFFMCTSCTLIFVPEIYHLTIDDERRRYELHDNTENNCGYVNFLGQVADCVVSVTAPDTPVLDYGCGKNAVLTAILREGGWMCDPFDPIFGHLLDGSSRRYGTIVLCEVIEHCRNVAATLADVKRLLAPGGVLILRTRLYSLPADIALWWYAQDLTHINFFSWQAIETASEVVGGCATRTDTADIFIIR